MTSYHLRFGDRRQWLRVPLSLQVHLRFACADAVVNSQTFDLSEGGAFVRMPNPREVGTPLLLRIDVGARSVAIQAVVVRVSSSPPGMGVRFVEVADEDREFVTGLVVAQAEQRSTPREI